VSNDLQIIFPTQGTVVAPGQSIVVKVKVANGNRFKGISVIGKGIITEAKTSPPYEFPIIIPKDGIGERELTAVGIIGVGQGAFSVPVRIDVEPSEPATRP